MRVMVTGHRPPGIGGWRTPNPTEQWVRSNLKMVLSRLLNREPKLVGISGMALGVDQIFVEECLRLGIPFIAAIPFTGQERIWPLDSQIHYRNLLGQAQEVVVVDQLPKYQTDNVKVKLVLGNKWMVDNSDKALVVWNGFPSGGTYNAVKEIARQNKGYIHINPSKFEMAVFA